MELFVKKFENCKFSEPNLVEDTEKNKYFSLFREAYKRIHWMLGFSYQMSRKIFNISEEIWEELVELTSLSANEGEGFDINNYYGVFYKDFIVAIVEDNIQEDINNFFKFIDSISESSIVTSNNIKLKAIIPAISEESSNEEFTPVMVIEMDYFTGYYCCFSGTYDGERILLNKKPILETSDIEEFVQYNFEYELKLLSSLGKSLDSYNRNLNHIPASMREVLDILDIIEADIRTNDEGMVVSISGIENSSFFMNFFNQFNIPFKSLKKMSWLRKSLKRDSLSVDDLVKASTNSFMKDVSVPIRVLTYVSNMNYSGADSIIVEEETK